jgi:hypothetical protein
VSAFAVTSKSATPRHDKQRTFSNQMIFAPIMSFLR